MSGEYPYAVVVTYSFDSDIAVHLCETEEKAKNLLMHLYKEEVKADQENGWDSTCTVSEEGWEAEIINHFSGHDDVTKFAVTSSVYINPERSRTEMIEIKKKKGGHISALCGKAGFGKLLITDGATTAWCKIRSEEVSGARMLYVMFKRKKYYVIRQGGLWSPQYALEPA